MSEKKSCAICGCVLDGERIAYLLKIELMADPAPPAITQEDLDKDLRAEMEALIAAMENMDPSEAEDEVYERYDYWLCAACRKRLHRRLKFPFLSLD
ncbi:MAG: hypothetical protein NTX50_22680 [Candidatus Sumerlaeota bacterium]|nr:hypothetical protein [Candidatus Sumerlaeota bacterium]